MEVCKIRIYFYHPIRLNKNHSRDKYYAPHSGQEGFNLHPSNDIVQRPGRIKKYSSYRKPPCVDWRVKENEEALPVT